MCIHLVDHDYTCSIAYGVPSTKPDTALLVSELTLASFVSSSDALSKAFLVWTSVALHTWMDDAEHLEGLC